MPSGSEIGLEEVRDPRDPQATNDPVLIGVFGAGQSL